MRSWPRILGRSFGDLLDWSLAVEKLREDDRREIADIQQVIAPNRLLFANLTAVGNVGVGEDNLMSYEFPNGLLTQDGHGFEFECAVKFAANANNKRVRAYLGSTLLFDTSATAFNDKSCVLNVTLIRKVSGQQACTVRFESSDTTLGPARSTYTDVTEILAAGTVFKLTGEATSTNDIVQKYMTAKWIPANLVEGV